MDIEAGLWAFSVILCSKVSYENQLPVVSKPYIAIFAAYGNIELVEILADGHNVEMFLSAIPNTSSRFELNTDIARGQMESTGNSISIYINKEDISAREMEEVNHDKRGVDQLDKEGGEPKVIDASNSGVGPKNANPQNGNPQRQENQPKPSMKGIRSKLNAYFHVEVAGNILLAYHQPGCQLIDFGNAAKAPLQAEILATLQVMGVNMTKIASLQNAGYNKYMLCPVRLETPQLTPGTINVKGTNSRCKTALCIDNGSNVTNLCPWGCCNGGFCCAEPSTSYFWLFGLLGAVITFFLILYFFRKCCSRPRIVQTSRDMGEMSQVNFAHSSRSIPAYYDPPPYISTISGTNPPVFPADCDLLPPYELPPSYEDACKGNNDNEQR